jgi:hypothetical protein
MTTERVRFALCLLLWLAAPRSPLSAAQSGVAVSIGGEDTLAQAAHTSISVLVSLSEASASYPLTLTPRIEGAAIELVRGRLLRSDAKPVDAAHLRFEVPVVARSQGTAILRVELMTYACDPDCHRVTADDNRALHVR